MPIIYLWFYQRIWVTFCMKENIQTLIIPTWFLAVCGREFRGNYREMMTILLQNLAPISTTGPVRLFNLSEFLRLDTLFSTRFTFRLKTSMKSNCWRNSVMKLQKTFQNKSFLELVIFFHVIWVLSRSVR